MARDACGAAATDIVDVGHRTIGPTSPHASQTVVDMRIYAGVRLEVVASDKPRLPKAAKGALYCPFGIKGYTNTQLRPKLSV